ncbi:hypothetical protein [Hyphomicrobium sp.]|uniref:hypothetical protein n=1 Tax=Hyphomicrobium sp. TaxID=82 RepID=UPI0025BE1AE9|nr:hypothetical protein [Hyphomicrobium sp.]
MTTTKIAYIASAIVPFGLVLLACYGIAYVAMTGLKDRRARKLALLKVPAKARVKAPA